jgi:hypothetical protein
MDWSGKFIDMVTGGLPGAALGAIPDHIKKQWQERLGDHNPFRTISTNHDLVRATRLAWIEAAQDVLKAAAGSGAPLERRQIEIFNTLVHDQLIAIRD